MSKFGHLKQLNCKQSTEYIIYQLDGQPVLVLAPATESNRGYFNALLRKSRKNMRVVQSGKVSASVIKQNRDEDRILYADHIITGWKKMLDSNGKEIPFTKEDCKEFIEEIPDWLFDEIRAFASNVQNFIEDAIDVEETAKN